MGHNKKRKKIENQGRNLRKESVRWALNTRERGLSYYDSRVQHSVCQRLCLTGVLLVPIHRDTLIILNNEKGGLLHNK